MRILISKHQTAIAYADPHDPAVTEKLNDRFKPGSRPVVPIIVKPGRNAISREQFEAMDCDPNFEAHHDAGFLVLEDDAPSQQPLPAADPEPEPVVAAPAPAAAPADAPAPIVETPAAPMTDEQIAQQRVKLSGEKPAGYAKRMKLLDEQINADKATQDADDKAFLDAHFEQDADEQAVMILAMDDREKALVEADPRFKKDGV